MRRRLLASLAATAAVAASLLISSAVPATAADTAAESASAATSRGGGGVTANAKLPEGIRVDEKTFKIVSTLRGEGKQVYNCNTATGKFDLREPVAGLFTLRGAVAGIHGQGPFWTNLDGSKFVGMNPVSAPSPAGPSNVAWLKVAKKEASGPGVFSAVEFVQRIDTRGGSAPASCTGTQTVAVDYSTNYVFWARK